MALAAWSINMLDKFSRFKSILVGIENKFSPREDLWTTPTHPAQNDLYLVEFPKSGITWLSCLIANMALLESNRKEIANINTAHMYIPDIHVTRDILNPIYDRPPVRFIKSHSSYNNNYHFIIYLVRHPEAVMKSYYRFHIGLGNEWMTYESFVKSDCYGVAAWKRHINSWLVGSPNSQRIHLLRYEDLLNQTVYELESINKNFGWEMSDFSIEKAVARSSMELMKDAEEFGRKRNPRNKLMFVGNKTEIEGCDELSMFINEKCKNELILLGYKN
jgi:Sulfotransferase domain